MSILKLLMICLCVCAKTYYSFWLFVQTSMLLVKVNDTKSCFPPLVATTNENSWYPYVDGCGLQCENVLYTEADHAHAHIFILVTGLSCLFCTLFTVVRDACKLKVFFLVICCKIFFCFC